MKQNNKKTGNRGEDLASDFLQNKGYLVVERNFSTRFGELDIVCLDGEILVFVEVKTKIGHDFGEPEEMVSKSKLGQVQRMGEVFIELSNLTIDDSDYGVMPDLIRHPEGTGFRVGARNDKGEAGKVWRGRCRVDVVGIVLTENGEVETIRHHEAVY